MVGMESDQFFFVPDGQGKSRVIVNTPFDNSIEIGKDLVDFVRHFCDDTNLFRVSNTRKNTSDFA
jgi:hypothetical protein